MFALATRAPVTAAHRSKHNRCVAVWQRHTRLQACSESIATGCYAASLHRGCLVFTAQAAVKSQYRRRAAAIPRDSPSSRRGPLYQVELAETSSDASTTEDTLTSNSDLHVNLVDLGALPQDGLPVDSQERPSTSAGNGTASTSATEPGSSHRLQQREREQQEQSLPHHSIREVVHSARLAATDAYQAVDGAVDSVADAILPSSALVPDADGTVTRPSPAMNEPAPQLLLPADLASSALTARGMVRKRKQKQPTVGSSLWWRKLPWPKLWALALLSISYIHQATTGFSLPAMLPMVSSELSLSDFQGAMLTTGYSYLYALALVPIGLLADRMSRPKLLAGGLALWSLLTVTASGAKSFQELITARVGFAAAQSAQNPISFSLIPELFPKHKSTALAVYNCAIYVGRALSFGAVLLARHLHDAPPDPQQTVQMVPLDALDLHSMSIVYTSGDMAAVTPVYDYNFNIVEYGAQLPDSSWRQVLRWVAMPGFLIALACLLSLPEPREAKIKDADVSTTSVASTASMTSFDDWVTITSSTSITSLDDWKPIEPSGAALSSQQLAEASGKQQAALAAKTALNEAVSGVLVGMPVAGGTALVTPPAKAPEVGTWDSVLKLLQSPTFLATTFAAALNDVGSYALIAWQSTFYERVYGLQPSTYAPVLALLLPIGGIIGGIGGGALADLLAKRGGRAWITGGASILSVPFLADSLLAGTYQESFFALLVGFALSEAWRAPSAVMARSIAPSSLGSTSSAVYLCIRNLVGGLGPLGVAAAAEVIGLQHALLLVPIAYLGSGLIFILAERLYERETLHRGSCNI